MHKQDLSVTLKERDYLEQLAVKLRRDVIAHDFVQLSKLSPGNSNGWTFNRDELHERQ
jgi:hypothetical protein